MKNFTKRVLWVSLIACSGMFALWSVSATTIQVTTTTNTSTSISTQDQQLVDMLKMKIDSLSLEKTEAIWNRFVQIESKIPNTHPQYRIIEWLWDYLQWSVDDKKEKMMMWVISDIMIDWDVSWSNTIADLAMWNDDLSMLVDIVVFLDLANTLKAEWNWTVFAPTNKAFEEALQMLWITAEQLMADKELLKKIVMHHIVDMKVTAETAMSLEYWTLVDTASWETIRVRSDSSKVWIDNATVIDADMMASNGIVHVIDKVLLPPSFQEMNGMDTDRWEMNIAEIAMSNDMFTTLVAWVQAADWADMLMMEWPWTVFAPTNEAFTKLLLENNMTVSQLLADKEMLKSVLSYHVVSGFYTSADIMWMESNAMWKTENWASLDIDPLGKVNGVSITKADIYATNWVIHVIDEVLLP